MTEPLVSLEVAKLLKDKGFNEWCEWAIDDKGEMYDLDAFTELYRINKLHPTGFYSRPSQSLAQKWLREKFKIHIDMTLHPNEQWSVEIVEISTMYTIEYLGLFNNYEEAIELALKSVLEHL